MPTSRDRTFAAAIVRGTLAASTILATTLTATPAQAGPVPTPDTLVSVCSGVSLPPSVVTDIMDPVLTGIYGPIEANVNQTLGVLDLFGFLGLPSPLSVDVNGLLTTAASGSDIGLQVLASDGTLVGPSDQCDAAADSFTLDTPAGVSIGGNQITGLGDPGEQAVAGEIDSIAIGNRATTDATATGSIAIGTDASVGAGAVDSVAIGNGASATGVNSVAIGAGTTATRDDSVSIGGRQLTDVAAGTQPTDGVNLSQLTAATENAVQYDDSSHTIVTLDGAGGTLITNLQAGAVNATSTDAVNGSQLFAVQTQVDGLQTQVTNNTNAITTLQTDVTNLQGDVTNLQTDVSNNTTAITNLQADVTNNTNAITTLQGDVTNLQTQVDATTTNITNLTNQIANGGIGPVQYSDAGSPTVPNGGTPTNHLTLVGGAPGPVGLHNVDEGVIASGSTDAINGGQLFDALAAIPDGIADAVLYDDASHTSVTLNSGGPATVIHNVGPGVLPNDAVNVSQLNNAMGNTLNLANSYTDLRFDLLDRELSRDRGDARSGTAAALAAAGLPQAMGEGRTMISGAVGTYRGKMGFAAGASYRAENGRSIYRVGITYDSSEHLGANAGAGFEF